jgi:hypothetical protein
MATVISYGEAADGIVTTARRSRADLCECRIPYQSNAAEWIVGDHGNAGMFAPRCVRPLRRFGKGLASRGAHCSGHWPPRSASAPRGLVGIEARGSPTFLP